MSYLSVVAIVWIAASFGFVAGTWWASRPRERVSVQPEEGYGAFIARYGDAPWIGFGETKE